MVSSNIILDKDLKIHNVEDIKDELLRKLDVKGDITIDLSSVEKIDISGLQLLISIVAELKELKKIIYLLGSLKVTSPRI
ncbi:STAS domain-containing protein [Thiospirochaeta perfilievii]|uniref:STAS domain-containing protein n=1 Tax=Thiospirochaeta perfilievii TaxID=252967 RepID=A0A5C1Q7J0_9SPIO|nr:STAS domain-containing protein [Thiospirochaeta perfilievii]QEN03995.1 STAS domain-containing protein [Thiospirochaeta perfilievii]